MFYIIIGLIILGLLVSLIEWIGEHKEICARVGIVVLLGICISLFGFTETFIIVVYIAVISVLVFIGRIIIAYVKEKNEDELNTYLNNNWFKYECITEDEWRLSLPQFASKLYTTSFEQITSNFTKKIKQKNEDELNTYLINNCVRCGHVTEDSWKAMLPQFASKSYPTSFKEVTSDFAKRIEKQYITGDEQLKWLDPAIHYLTNNLIAEIAELELVPSEGLKFTHFTPNGKLIFDAMENLCKVKVVEGKNLIQKIQLTEDDSIREQLKIAAGVSIPEYYKAAYKINDYFANKRQNDIVGNIESEEISFDDL